MGARWILLILTATLLVVAAADTNPLQGLQDAVNAAINSTNNALQSAANATGNAITSASNATSSALQSTTNTVAAGLNTTVNSTENAAQQVASSGAPVLAGVLNTTGLTAIVGGPVASAVEKLVQNGVRHPVVFFPGFGTSRLSVNVDEQELEPDCPNSGSFHVAFGNPTVLEGWPESCIYKLLEIQYDPDVPQFNERFSSQPGVNVTLANFGSTLCAPIPYEPTYLFYQTIGYTVGYDFFVGCYDWRVSPFQDVASDGPWLERAQELVETAYKNTGRPVYLMAHSNGGLQALALLNTTSADWRSKYIAGLVGFAGNWAGQGGTYAPIFSGQSLFASNWYSGAAAAWESWPAAYMQLADPAVYNSSEVVIRATVDGQVKNYTTADYAALFRDANLTLAQELAAQLVGNLTVKTTTPGTHFYGYYGSGQSTLVGVTLPNLAQGSTPQSNGDITATGDGNQEATDNLSAQEWQQRQSSCYDFQLKEEAGVSHLSLPLSPSVLADTVNILFKTPKQCASTVSASSAG